MKKIALLMFMSTLFTVMPAHADVASFKAALTTARDHAVADTQALASEITALTQEEADEFQTSLTVPELAGYIPSTYQAHFDLAVMYDALVGAAGGTYAFPTTEEMVNEYKEFLAQQKEQDAEDEAAEQELEKSHK